MPNEFESLVQYGEAVLVSASTIGKKGAKGKKPIAPLEK